MRENSQKVLALLRSAPDGFLSTEDLLRRLDCTLSSLRTNISYLRTDLPKDTTVESVHNRGYRLVRLGYPRRDKRLRAEGAPPPDDYAFDGQDYQPDHLGDPLLEALEREHGRDFKSAS